MRQPAVNGRGPTADAFSALVVQVLQTAGALETAGNDLARPAGQSTARWQVLAAVEEQPATVAAVARVLALARQSVQRVADSLAADGLVRYVDNPAHQRAKLLELTHSGAQTLRAIQTRQAQWAERCAAGLDPATLEVARRTLQEVLSRIRAA